MKILLLIPGLGAGGTERKVVTLANKWAEEHDVTLLLYNQEEPFYRLSGRVKMKTVNAMPLKSGRLARALSIPYVICKRYRRTYVEIKDNHYDFILSFLLHSNIHAALISRRLRNEKILITENSDPYRYSGYRKLLCNCLYKLPKAIICQNRIVKEYFEKRGFPCDLEILPNPLCLEDIPTESPQMIKKEIVTVGRLEGVKNQKMLIDAFAALAKDYPEYSLKIYGAGPLEEKLREQIRALHMDDKIKLMGKQKRVMFEVAQATAFILASNYEGFPNVLLEAMACGLPVISTDFATGIARELIRDGDNGYLVPVGNRLLLEQAIRTLLDRKDLREMGEKNKGIALQYRDDMIAPKWLETIQKVISKK